MSGLLVLLALLCTGGIVFAVFRSRGSSGSASGEAGSSKEHQRLSEKTLRIFRAELSLDEEIAFIRHLSPQMAEWMNLLAADKVDEAMRGAEAVHAATPSSRPATCFLMRARLAMGDNQGAAQIAQTYFSAVGNAEVQSQLQTWYHLREMNVIPDQETASTVLGVIVEVNYFEEDGAPAMPLTLAAYLDGSSVLSRGQRTVLARPESQKQVHEAAQQLVAAVMEVERPAPGAHPTKPVEDHLMRFTVLTAGGPAVIELNLGEVQDNKSHPLFKLLLLATHLQMLISNDKDFVLGGAPGTEGRQPSETAPEKRTSVH
ncbi:hypothetical protein KRR26_29745 [Corallococcus sp. M34]|uniref:hypothetical protein n=1 Tax=Citreicoccus inhibens TaxID=2849499 RepID=UPI001C2488A8|nr:hypothetical protein [Citreicoccus inhibens]MBU8899803.1 hypothetical protein [Citreicoccus inhibens]